MRPLRRSNWLPSCPDGNHCDNRTAVDGIVGAELVAQAAPDGHTLLMAASSHAINVASGKKVPYDTIKDFAPITLTTNQDLLLLANPSLPVRTMKELIAYLRANPNNLNYASSSAGTALPIELFKTMTSTTVQNIPYKGSSPQMIMLVAGDVQIAMAAAISAMSYVNTEGANNEGLRNYTHRYLRARPGGISHISFIVDDVQQVADELIEKGIPLAGDLQDFYEKRETLRTFLVHDPDGILVQFERAP